MNPNKLSIRFVILKAKINKQGLCAISCRLTFKSKRKAFSTGLFVNPDNWNAKKQVSNSKPIAGQQLNTQLQIIEGNIKKEYLKLQLSEIEFTVEDIFKHYLGKPARQETFFIAYFKKLLEKKNKLIGIDIELATWKKYYYACIQAESFIQWQYKKQDIPFSKLTPQFLIVFILIVFN